MAKETVKHTTFGKRDGAQSESAGLPPRTNAVHELQSLLSNTFGDFERGQVDESSPAGACLRPILAALGWSGEPRHIFEALPHIDRVNDVEGLRAVLASLNFETAKIASSSNEISPAMLPCLLEKGGEELAVGLCISENGKLLIFDGVKRDFVEIEPCKSGYGVYTIKEIDDEVEQLEITKSGWVQTLFGKFKRIIAVLFALSLAVNLLALLVPLYIIGVYDLAIGAKSVTTLLSMLTGIMLIITAEIGLRVVRGRAIAYMGARVESLISMRAFQQLLYLPVNMTESSSIATQVTRLRQYQNVRDLFTGSLAPAILDLPFITVFVIAAFAVGGVLGFIPVALIAVYGIMAAITIPLAKTHLRQAGAARSAMRNFLTETTTKHRTISEFRAKDAWDTRFEDLVGDQLSTQFKAQHFNVTVQTIAQMLMVVAGAVTIGLGTVLAMDGAVSIGGLIGTTALVWRGLSPIQSTFLGLSRLSQSIESMRQINQLMRIPLERQPGKQTTLYREFKGNIAVLGVSMRYPNQTEPALNGITLNITEGETIAITGNSGAGKTTLLKVIAGLYRPQVGVILIDDLNTRQLDMGELRNAIGIVPQKQSFFYGTIRQNMRLAHPSASQDDIERALARVGALETVKRLENGIDFRLHGSRETRFPEAFLKQLMLARAFVKDAAIYLLDEPGTQLDLAGDKALVETLRAEKGKSTTLIVTHRPSHMELADRVIVMHQGRAVAEGPPEEIVPLITATGEPIEKERLAG